MKISDSATLEHLLSERFKHHAITGLKDLPPPSLFRDMDKAADRIAAAIAAQEPITVVGDYDADGVCASAVLVETLTACGAKPHLLIPNRFADGYGLSPDLVDRIESGVIVTVDNGISAHEAASRAKVRGLTLIVTDHHLAPEVLPDAYAIVNPKQPGCSFGLEFDELCGTAVAWYLGAALKKRLKPDFDLAAQLDVVMLATLADSVPLVGPNRTLAQAGLRQLNQSKRPFVWALRTFLDRPSFTYEDIAFQIAPRLNAAGRMEHAQAAYEFLSAESTDGAMRHLHELDRLNRERKETENRLLALAQDQVSLDDAGLVVHGEGWHEGVIGIVAARLAQRFKRPSVVISEKGGVAKGSARTVGAVDLFSLIAECREHLSGFGGHKKAAGIKLDAGSIADFKAAFQKSAALLDGALFEANEALLGSLDLRLITPELWALLQRYEPFGEGNLQPLFKAENLKVLEVRKMGKEGQHLRLKLSEEAYPGAAEAVAFFTDRQLEAGMQTGFYYTLSLNEFNSTSRMQMSIREFL